MQYYFMMEHCGGMVKMTEEQVTKKLLEWLISNNWEIITYDFPQSGTGKYLHPNKEIRNTETKNKKSFIPDIVAFRDNIAIFFENKNRFFLNDFIKLKEIKENNIYSESINKLLLNYNVDNIFYGIGAISNKKFLEKSSQYKDYIDFILLVDDDIIIIEKNNVNLF